MIHDKITDSAPVTVVIGAEPDDWGDYSAVVIKGEGGGDVK